TLATRALSVPYGETDGPREAGSPLDRAGLRGNRAARAGEALERHTRVRGSRASAHAGRPLAVRGRATCAARRADRDRRARAGALADAPPPRRPRGPVRRRTHDR